MNVLLMAALLMSGDPREVAVNPPVPAVTLLPWQATKVKPSPLRPRPEVLPETGKFRATINRRVLVLPHRTYVAYEWSLEYDPAMHTADIMHEIRRLNQTVSRLNERHP
jgi:hypothetical protein